MTTGLRLARYRGRRPTGHDRAGSASARPAGRVAVAASRCRSTVPPTDRVRPRSGGTSKPGVGGWDQNACCKARVTNSSGMVARALPAADLLTDQVLKGAPVGPLAVGQRQTRDIADSHPVRLGRLGLVEESVRGAFGSGGSAARARSRSCAGGRLWAARARRPRRRIAARRRCRPTRCPFCRSATRRRRVF